MRVQTLSGVSRRIATEIIRQKAYDTEKRWILSNSDLTADDKEEIKATAALVKSILTAGNGKEWSVTLKRLHDIATSGFSIGFKAQDSIITSCEKCGIAFARRCC